MTDALIIARDLGMAHPVPGSTPVTILSGVTCQIGPGERIALIGPSGSGKSTLLHLLAGLITPTSGQVTWPGLGLRDALMPDLIQMVFQAPSLFPALNVQDNIALPLLLSGRPTPPGDLLAQFGLAELATKLPEEISGGQAQRIAMLRALRATPRVILADEPTGQLDSATAQSFLTAVIRIASANGAALVIATHDPAVAARLDRHWTIDHGTLWATPTEMEASA